MISLSKVALALPETLEQLANGKLTPRPKRSVSTDAQVAIVQLVGVIDEESSLRVQSELTAAAANEAVGEIALVVDSPGGFADASFALAESVHEAAQRKPVHAYVAGTGASGAYLVASQATSVAASEWSGVGSIGTYAVLVDSSELMERLGVKVLVIRAGRFKGVGIPGTKLSEADQEELGRVVDNINRLFLAAVVRGRAIPMKTMIEQLATGQVWIGREALGRRLVDRIEPLSAWLSGLARRNPAEQFTELIGEAAVAQFNRLCGEHSSRSIDRIDVDRRQSVASRFPTLAKRAIEHQQAQRRYRESLRETNRTMA